MAEHLKEGGSLVIWLMNVLYAGVKLEAVPEALKRVWWYLSTREVVRTWTAIGSDTDIYSRKGIRVPLVGENANGVS